MPSASTTGSSTPGIEMAKDLVIALLDADRHDRIAFDCGEPALNDYLQKAARQHLQNGIANAYVLVRRDDPRNILGFFTLRVALLYLYSLSNRARNSWAC